MEKKQEEVLQWWYGNRDYQSGVQLFGKYGKNKVLLGSFIKPGKERVMSGKLHYEVCKAVGLDYKKMPLPPDGIEILTARGATVSPPLTFDPQGGEGKTPEEEILPDAPYIPEKYIPIISDIKALQYPKVIRRITMEYQENYQQRSILHKQMVAIGEQNSDKNIADRKMLLKQIHEKSARMEYLYAFMKRYDESKVVPLEEEVWPPEPDTELPADIEELKKLKKNLQTNNVKDNNLLQFQQKTKADKENHMPAGPKRTRIELRMKRKEKEILAIDNKIVELENL